MAKRNFNLIHNFLFGDWEDELNESLSIKTNRMIQGMNRLSLSDINNSESKKKLIKNGKIISYLI